MCACVYECEHMCLSLILSVGLFLEFCRNHLFQISCKLGPVNIMFEVIGVVLDWLQANSRHYFNFP